MSGTTSEFGYLVKTDPAVQYAADQPLDAISTRALLNNVCHLSDQSGQARVDWQDKTGATFTPSAANTYLQIMSWVFPLTLRQSGDSYKLRVRFGGYCSGTGTFRAVIGTPSLLGPASSWGITDDRAYTTAVLGSSDAWVTGTSDGTASPTLMTLTAAQVPATSFETTVDFGGLVSSIVVPYVQLSVYGRTNDVTKPVILTGAYCAEFVGQS